MRALIKHWSVWWAAWGLELVPESVGVVPHEDHPFTQGLVSTSECGDLETQLDGCLAGPKGGRATCYRAALTNCGTKLYESVGGFGGQSEVRVVSDFGEGHAHLKTKLPKVREFAEGIDLISPSEFLLGTWRDKRIHKGSFSDGVIAWDATYAVQTEIWGLASDRQDKFWTTTGGNYLLEYELPTTQQKALKPLREIKLTCKGKPVEYVNELEYDPWRNVIWGNVWFSDTIYVFDPVSGECQDSMRLHRDARLAQIHRQANSRHGQNAVWNGLALLSEHWLIFTGKMFPYLFLAKLQ